VDQALCRAPSRRAEFLLKPQPPGDRDEALAELAAAAREAEQLAMLPFTEWIEQLQARRGR
jgi:hypothetical protein